MDIKFGIWNVSSLHRVGTPSSVTNEIEKYRLDLVGSQKVIWDSNGTVIENNKGSVLVVEQVQIPSCDSHEQSCPLAFSHLMIIH